MPSLRLLVLWTHRLEHARAFYSLLGFDFKLEQHPKGAKHYAAVMKDGVFELFSGGAGQVDNVRLGFGVSDLEMVLKNIESKIVTGPQQTEFGYRAVVEDPDGRLIELYQEAK